MAGIGVLRVGEDVLRAALFDDVAAGHHAHLGGKAPHDAEVVGDEQQRQPRLLLQVGEEPEDLRLHGHVERGRRLVGDQEVRFVGERHGDHHALTLAAGKLVRIGTKPALGVADADLLKQLKRARLGRRLVQAAMHLHHLAHLPLDRVQRVERGHRLLEDDADFATAHGAQLLVGGGEQVLALEMDLAGRMDGRGRQQAHHRERRHRLARAGFADQRHRLALGDVECGAFDRHGLDAALLEGDAEILDREEGGVAHSPVPDRSHFPPVGTIFASK